MRSSGGEADRNCDGADLPSFEDEAGEEEGLLPDMAEAGKREGDARLSGDAVPPPVVSRSQSDLMVSRFLSQIEPISGGCSRRSSNSRSAAADGRRGIAQHGPREASSSIASTRQSDRPKQAAGKRTSGAAATKSSSEPSRSSTSSHNFSLSPEEPPFTSYPKFITLPKCIAFVSSSSRSRRDDPRRLLGNYGEAYTARQGSIMSGTPRDHGSGRGSSSALASISGPASSRQKKIDNLDPVENDEDRCGEPKFGNGWRQTTTARRSTANERKPHAEVKSAASFAVRDPTASCVRARKACDATESKAKRQENQATRFHQERPLNGATSSHGADAAAPSIREPPKLPRRSQATASGAHPAWDHPSHLPPVSSSPGASENAVRASEEAHQKEPPLQTKNKTTQIESTSHTKSSNLPSAVKGTIGLLPKPTTHQDAHNRPRNSSWQHLRADIAESKKSGVVAGSGGGRSTKEQSHHLQLSSLPGASVTKVSTGEPARRKEPPTSKQQEQKVIQCEPTSHARLSKFDAVDDGTMKEVLPILSSKRGPSTPNASVGGSHRKDRSCLQPMPSTHDSLATEDNISERAQRKEPPPQQQQQDWKNIVNHQSNLKPKSFSPTGEETVGLSPNPIPTPGGARNGGTSSESSSCAPAAAADDSAETTVERWSGGEEQESCEKTPESHVLRVKDRLAAGEIDSKSDRKAGENCGNLSTLSLTLRRARMNWTMYDRRHASPYPLSGANAHRIGIGRCNSTPRSVESHNESWTSNRSRQEMLNENRKKFRKRVWDILEDYGGPMTLADLLAKLKKMEYLDVGMELRDLLLRGHMEGLVTCRLPPGSSLYLAIKGREHETRSRHIDDKLRSGHTGTSEECAPAQTYAWYGPLPQMTRDFRGYRDEGRMVRSPYERSVSSGEGIWRRSHTKKGRERRTSDGDSGSASSSKRYFPGATNRGRGSPNGRSSCSNRRLSLDISSSPDRGKGGSRVDCNGKSKGRLGRHSRERGTSDDDSDGASYPERDFPGGTNRGRGSTDGRSSRSYSSLRSDISSSNKGRGSLDRCSSRSYCSLSSDISSANRGRGSPDGRSSRYNRRLSSDLSSPDGSRAGSRGGKSKGCLDRYSRRRGTSDDDSDGSFSLERDFQRWTNSCGDSSDGCSSRSHRSPSSDISSSPDRRRAGSRNRKSKRRSGRYSRGNPVESSISSASPRLRQELKIRRGREEAGPRRAREDILESSMSSDSPRLTRKLENRRGCEEAGPRGGARGDSLESSMSCDSPRRRMESGSRSREEAVPRGEHQAPKRRKAISRKKRDRSADSKGSRTDKVRTNNGSVGSSAVKKQKKVDKDAPREQSKGNDAPVDSVEVLISSAITFIQNKSGGENEGKDQRTGKSGVSVSDHARPEQQSSNSTATAMEEKSAYENDGKDQETRKSVVGVGDDAQPERQSSSSAATAMEEKSPDDNDGKDQETRKSVVGVGDDAQPERRSSSSAAEAMLTSTKSGEDQFEMSTKTVTRRPDNEEAFSGSSVAAGKEPEEDGEIAGPIIAVEKTPKMKMSIKPFTIKKKAVASIFRCLR